MSVQAISWALKQKLPTATKFVLVALCNYADQEGRCWPSQDSLATDTSMSSRTVRTHLKKLENLQIIERTARWKERGSRSSDVYLIHTETYRKEIPVSNTIPENDDRHTGNSQHTIPENDDRPYRKEIPGNRQVEPSIEPSIEPFFALAESGPEKYSSTFTEFWEIYPKHVAEDVARKEWAKAIKRENPKIIIERLEGQLPWFATQQEGGKDFRPRASVWLREGRWKDDIQTMVDGHDMAVAALKEKWRREENASEQNADNGICDRQDAVYRIAPPGE